MSDPRRDTPPTLSVHGGLRPRSPAEALEPSRAPVRPQSQRKKRRPQNRRVSRFVRVISGVMTLSLMALVAVVTIIAVVFHEFEKQGPLQVTQTVSIPKGEGRIEIARRLEREGIISSRWAFVLGYLVRSGWNNQTRIELKAGEYEIKSGASMRNVLDTLIEGKSVLYNVTIPEGLTSQQIVERLRDEENLTGEILDIPAEGTILPETYSFSRNTDRNELLARMMASQTKVLEALWDNRDPKLPVSSPQEAIVLASIVEKETGRADERDRVAAVFTNRLKKNMRLQSDPTIIYGIVGGQGRLGRSITKTDIAKKTDYNTYRISGLPPGPICNPGRASIAATLNPASTDELYFVADGTGGHVFSKTLKDHNAAVAKWRQVERERRIEAQQDQDASATSNGTGGADQDDIPNPSTTQSNGAGDDLTVPPIADIAAAVANDASGREADNQSGTVTGLRASTIPLPIRRPPQ